MLQGFTSLVEGLLQAFTDPASRTYWGGLLGMLFVILGLHLFRHKSTTTLLNDLVPWKLWKHHSSRLDVQLLLGKQTLRFIGFFPAVAGSWWIATHLVRRMDNWFGKPHLDFSPLFVSILYTVTLFIAWDASRYIIHRAFHGIPVLWQFHQVHHSAEVLTPLTFHRTHPFETLIFQLRGVLVSGLITALFFWLFRTGATDIKLFEVHAIGFMCNIATGNLRHSHIPLGFGKLEQLLLSPAQHQLHHSLDKTHHHANYGTWIALWDRIGGTFQRSLSNDTLQFGIPAAQRNHGHNLITAWLGPLVGISRMARMKTVIPVALGLLGISALANHALGNDDQEVPSDVPEDEDDEIIIVSEKGIPLVAGSAHIVTEESLERMEYDDIHRVLIEVPGVYVRGEDGFGLRPNIGIRGANSDRSAKITLMEDGVLLAPAPYAAPAAYYFPMTSRMTGIEVFKGAAGTQFGPNTVGGAINLLSREPGEKNASGLDISLGNRLNSKAHGWTSAVGDNWSILAEGIALHAGGFKELESNAFTGFNRSEFMVKAATSAGSTQRIQQSLKLKLGFAHENSSETYLGLSTDDYEQNPYLRYPATENAKMIWHRTQAELHWPVRIGENIQIRTVAYHHYLNRSWTKFNRFSGSVNVHDVLLNPATGQSAVYLDILRGREDSISDDQNLMIGTNHRQFHSYGLQSRFRIQHRSEKINNRLEFGLRFHGDDVHRLHTEDPHRMEDGGLTPTGADTLTQLDSNAKAYAIAAHVHDDLGIGALRVIPGLRMESIWTRYDMAEAEPSPMIHRASLMPGMGLNAELSDWADLFGGVHRGFSPVAPGQAKDVSPEISWNYEIGLRLHPGVRFELIGFINDYTNLTGACTISSGCDQDDIGQQFNGGAALIYGTEFSMAHVFYLPAAMSLPIQVSYTWTNAQFQSDFFSGFSQFGAVKKGYRLPYVPEHQSGIQIGLEHPNFHFTLVGQLRSGMLDSAGPKETAPEGGVIPALGLLDASVAVPINDRFRLYATANNVLGNQSAVSWRPFGARPTAPRQFMIGLKMQPRP